MLVSVITSVYNCEKYIRDMINSILKQTYEDWELIIIDDASTDNTWEALMEFHDIRIVKIRNKINKGLTINLNYALKMARGKYIIRIDGDDIASKFRIEKQVSFMESNSNILLAGSWMRTIGESQGLMKSEVDSMILKIHLLFNTVIFHPTFIFRKIVSSQYGIYYNEELRYAQDYDFEYRVSLVGKIANQHEILTRYRIHNNQSSCQKSEEQLECANSTRRKILKNLNIQLNENEEKIWFDYCLFKKNIIDDSRINVLKEICKKVIIGNLEKKIYNDSLLRKINSNRMQSYISYCMKYENNIEKELQKKSQILELTNQWLILKQRGLNLAKWFIENGFRKIAIYGMGILGKTLFFELQNTEITIKFAVDKNIYTSFNGLEILNTIDNTEKVDVFVITPIFYFDEIKHEMEEKNDCPIISLDEIIYDLIENFY